MNNSVARLKIKQVNKSYKKARGSYQYLSEAEKEKNGNMDANDIKIVLNQMLVDYSNYFNQYNICIYTKS